MDLPRWSTPLAEGARLRAIEFGRISVFSRLAKIAIENPILYLCLRRQDGTPPTMDQVDYIRFLEKAVRGQRLAQQFHVGLAVGVVVLGLLAVGGAQVFSGVLIPENQKWLVTLGGSFLSTLCAFPIKQIADRRTKISALEFLLDGFGGLGTKANDSSGKEAAQLTERFWKLMDASLET